MRPAAAERCLQRIARLIKPDGDLFVSGVDLDVRAQAARTLGWKPVMELIREIHDGDASLRERWPTEYWTMEPFDATHRDRLLRYAAAFRLSLHAFLVLALT